MTFADRLTEATHRCGAPLCVGLDPFPDLLPPLFGHADNPAAWDAFFTEVLEQLAGRVPVIKPQIGLFEPWGQAGVALTAQLAQRARSLGLLVLIDAKRGDIGSTAQGYARTFLGPDAAVPGDCVTHSHVAPGWLC